VASIGLGMTLFHTANVFLDDFYEKTIPDDFAEGEKRAIQLGPKESDSVLVVKYQDKYYCTSNSCCHFGYSLAKSTLVEDKITCALHFA
jgi:nitrite reductase/ring-hydroxylating ferredoxin subunit